MSSVCTRTKRAYSDQKRVEIKEYINTSEAFRSCDPQTGSTLLFKPRYKVTETVADLKTTYFADMEEVYKKYPWFFVK